MGLVKLSIMILSLPNRLKQLGELVTELEIQSKGLPVEILYLGDDQSFPIGQKRNMLKRCAQGDYSTWIDDDDFVHPSYIKSIMQAIEHSPDVICWTNKVFVGGYKMIPHPVVTDCHFSIKHNPERRDLPNKTYYFRPCHINPIKHSIAMAHSFPECSYCRSDGRWGEMIANDLKTEYIIPIGLYYHRYGFTDEKGKAPRGKDRAGR